MEQSIKSTNLRFNLNKPEHLKAWNYLQDMDKGTFKSYTSVVATAINDYFDKYYRSLDDPYFETREREELFIKRIISAVDDALSKSIPLFLSGYMTAIAIPTITAPITVPAVNPSDSNDNSDDDNDDSVDWSFIGE